MRHGVKNKKLGVNAQHKRAILRALTTSILEKGMETDQNKRYVRTTLHKAKLVRSCVERMITYAKKGDLSARREAARFVMDPKVLQDLFNTIGPRYANRNGGYTRVLKLGPNRAGDAAEMLRLRRLLNLPRLTLLLTWSKAKASPLTKIKNGL